MTQLQPAIIRKLNEIVVNRIAAGEVIQRPANAVKELLENSLDAKASNIQVTVKNGGLKLLQIQDNGTGIRKEDLKIVCLRFTTSKLVEFEDLNTIATFGFRGEALASISHVAHLSIITKTSSESCAYKGTYKNGKLLESVKPCAGNQGTLITIEDLFYNVPTRRNAFKNFNEEYTKLADVISRYAIHNPSVGFTLRKQGESLAEIRTNENSTHVDNIRTIYGNTIAGSLEEVEVSDDALKFTMKGYITNANFSVKKQIFLLFINNRLVDCADLRKKLDSVYDLYLPKGTHSFIYLSITLDPRAVDVNVHPTKYEVNFLHEEIITDKIKSAVETKLLGCNAARTYYTQSKLPVSIESVSSGLTTAERIRAIAPNYQVRTDPSEQKLDKYFSSSSAVIRPQVTEPDYPESRRTMRLKSVMDIRKEIEDNVCESFQEILRNHSFVGVSCPVWTLIQHKTELYACNMTKLMYETIYQLMVYNFGNLGAIKFVKPLNICQLMCIGLKYSDKTITGITDEEKTIMADRAAQTLYSKKEMLNDYFSMEIDSDCNLVTIPLVLDNYTPEMEELPMYLWRLATEVDWISERRCFQTFCEHTAKFYSEHYWKDVTDLTSLADEEKRESGWYWTIEHVLLPCMRKHLLPSKSLKEQRAILQLDKLPQLYSEFDRC